MLLLGDNCIWQMDNALTFPIFVIAVISIIIVLIFKTFAIIIQYHSCHIYICNNFTIKECMA